MATFQLEPIYTKNLVQINETKQDVMKPTRSYSNVIDPTWGFLFNRKDDPCISGIGIIFLICQLGVSYLACLYIFLYELVGLKNEALRIPYITASFLIITGFNLSGIISGILPSGIPEFTDESITQNKFDRRHVMNILTLLWKCASFFAAFMLAKLIIYSETIPEGLFFKDGFVMIMLMIVLYLHAAKEIMMMYFQGKWLNEYGKIGGRYWIDHEII